MRQRKTTLKLSTYEDDSRMKLPKNKSSKLLPYLIALKIMNIFLVQTWFVPDEYWQSLEVAHSMVFGYGFLTWEWKIGMRSYLYPLLIAGPYKVMQMLGADWVFLLKFVPRLIQAVMTAVSEWCFYLSIDKVFGESIAKWSLECLLTSWFWWYCSSRTLINTFETNLICVGIFLYLRHAGKYVVKFTHLIPFVAVAVVAFFVRPTCSTVWIPVFLCYLWRLAKKHSVAMTVNSLVNILLIAIPVLLLCAIVDQVCYGRWISVHINFVLFNVINNQGTFYGENPWHWYITQGLPVVVGSHLPLSILGCFYSFHHYCRADKALYSIKRHTWLMFSLSIIITLLVYSIPGHKEFRFILVLLPFTSFFSGYLLSVLDENKLRWARLFLFATNIPIALYAGLVHQKAPPNLLNELQSQSVIHNTSVDNNFALFLMPCHSTPYFSHLHTNLTMRFLTCEPNLNNIENYKDESEQFDENPVGWLNKEYAFAGCPLALPKHILMYNVLYENLKVLLSTCYHVCFKTFHTHFPEGRIGQYGLMLCKNS